MSTFSGEAQSEQPEPRPSSASDRQTGEKGRLSNPVQRRLSANDSRSLPESYAKGLSIKDLADRFEVHRTTITHHLDIQGVARRRNIRKLTDVQVARAARQYENGLSLATVAAEFSVHERTLTREFRLAGIPTRPRRGRE